MERHKNKAPAKIFNALPGIFKAPTKIFTVRRGALAARIFLGVLCAGALTGPAFAYKLSESQIFEWWDAGLVAADEAEEMLALLDEGNLEEACMLAEIYAFEPCDGESIEDATSESDREDSGKADKVSKRKKRAVKSGSAAKSVKSAKADKADGRAVKSAKADGRKGLLNLGGYVLYKARYDSSGRLKSHREELLLEFYRFSLRLGSREQFAYRYKHGNAYLGQFSWRELRTSIPTDTLWGAAAAHDIGLFSIGAALDTSGTAFASLGATFRKKYAVSIAYWRSDGPRAVQSGTASTIGGDAVLIDGAVPISGAVPIKSEVPISGAVPINSEVPINDEVPIGAETFAENNVPIAATARSLQLQASMPFGKISVWHQFGEESPLVKAELHGRDSASIAWHATAYFHGDSIPARARLSESIAKNRVWATQSVSIRDRELADTRISASARIAAPLHSDSVSGLFTLHAESGPRFLRAGAGVTCLDAAENCRRTTYQAEASTAHGVGEKTLSAYVAAKTENWDRPRTEIGFVAEGKIRRGRQNKFRIALVAPDTRPADQFQIKSETTVSVDFLDLSLAASFKKKTDAALRPSYATLSAKIWFR